MSEAIARAALAAVAKLYGTLESLTAKIEIRSSDARQSGSAAIAFRAPNKFAVATTTGSGVQRQVSDGVHFFHAHSADPGRHSRFPMPRAAHGRIGLMQYGVFGLLNPFLAGVDPLCPPWGEVPDSVELSEPEDAGDSVIVVRVLQGRQETVYHIGRDDSLLLRTDFNYPSPTGTTSVSCLYSDIRLNPPLRDAEFEFIPSPGSEEAVNAYEYLRSGLKAGVEAPDFEAVTLSGGHWRLGDHRGKTVIVDFWSSGCAPCREEMHNLKDLHARYHERGLEIVGISADTHSENLLAYLAESELPWPQLFDGRGLKGDIARLFRPRGVPTIILVGPDGRIVSVGSRFLVLRDEIERGLSRG